MLRGHVVHPQSGSWLSESDFENGVGIAADHPVIYISSDEESGSL